MIKCEGSCDALDYGHYGNIRKVHIFDDRYGKDWGEWFYCQCAVDGDINNGFRVEEIEDD